MTAVLAIAAAWLAAGTATALVVGRGIRLRDTSERSVDEFIAAIRDTAA